MYNLILPAVGYVQSHTTCSWICTISYYLPLNVCRWVYSLLLPAGGYVQLHTAWRWICTAPTACRYKCTASICRWTCTTKCMSAAQPLNKAYPHSCNLCSIYIYSTLMAGVVALISHVQTAQISCNLHLTCLSRVCSRWGQIHKLTHL